MYGKIKRIHMVGIGGAGMSGIAEVLINLGYQVTGSDIVRSHLTDRLEKIGAKIYYEHRGQNVHGADVVVISSAISPNNVEVLEAKKLGIPVIKRAEMLAELMRLKYGIAVSGSHGKTTTTSIITKILTDGGLDPTAIIGGKLRSLGSGAKLGTGQFLVAEADESDGSFQKLNPVIVVITNIDEEHLDFYGSFENVKQAFVDFASGVPFYGLAALCIDDPGVMDILSKIERRVLTYGFSPHADLRAKDVKFEKNGSRFSVLFHGKELGRICFHMKGEHNVLNALAGIGVGLELGIDFKTISEAIESFDGVHRRFEIKGEKMGVTVVDDYGHHPTEIACTLKTAREEFPERRLVVVFQPHRYTRSKILRPKFPPALKEADVLILTEVYPAGEKLIEGGTGKDLFMELQNHGLKNVIFVESLEEACERVKEVVRKGDVLITLGAGNVYRVGERFLEEEGV